MNYILENYDSIAENVAKLSNGRTRLLAVSKTFPVENIELLYSERGVKEFAESRLNELQAKYEALPKDIIWHYIGKIQSNKLKKIAAIAGVIHSVEKVETIEKLAEICEKNNSRISYFIEVNISQESSKSGIAESEINSLLETAKKYSSQVKCVGFMTMAPLDASNEELNNYFSRMRELLEQKRQEFKLETLTELSMGMSGDYPFAIKNGSTIVRIGSSIFGRRNYL